LAAGAPGQDIGEGPEVGDGGGTDLERLRGEGTRHVVGARGRDHPMCPPRAPSRVVVPLGLRADRGAEGLGRRRNSLGGPMLAGAQTPSFFESGIQVRPPQAPSRVVVPLGGALFEENQKDVAIGRATAGPPVVMRGGGKGSDRSDAGVRWLSWGGLSCRRSHSGLD